MKTFDTEKIFFDKQSFDHFLKDAQTAHSLCDQMLLKTFVSKQMVFLDIPVDTK